MADTTLLSRRRFFRGTAGLAAAGLVPEAAQAKARLGDDGLYTEDWYVDSFLDLPEDFAAARARGRQFAIQWSQRGCIYCKELHTVYFADPAVEEPIREAFDIVHLDLFGAREVTVPDGARLTEKALGQRERIRATPTFQFFAEDGGAPVEVARMPGLLPKAAFSAMFRYVVEGAFRAGPFDAWLVRQNGGKG